MRCREDPCLKSQIQELCCFSNSHCLLSSAIEVEAAATLTSSINWSFEVFVKIVHCFKGDPLMPWALKQIYESRALLKLGSSILKTRL